MGVGKDRQTVSISIKWRCTQLNIEDLLIAFKYHRDFN